MFQVRWEKCERAYSRPHAAPQTLLPRAQNHCNLDAHKTFKHICAPLKMNLPTMRTLGGFFLLGLFALSGCKTNDARYRDDTIYIGGYRGRVKEPERANFDNVSYWDGDHASGSPSISINLGEQRAYFYK